MQIATRGAALAAVAALAVACDTVQETGRSQFTMFSNAEMTQMGIEAYAESIKSYREITGTPEAEMVQRLGKRIAEASGRDYEWEFKLLDAPDTVNAFALPGGKVAIFSGIVPVAGNEDALAAVVGHEVAHATSRHGNERMSQAFAANLGLVVGAGAMELSDMDSDDKRLAIAALGGAVQLGALLPYSRLHETEADEIGLRFLIRAGYDPYQAPLFWERMAREGSGQVPEFLSTHPDPLNRAARLRELIPRLQREEEGRGL
ncbi:MAG: M48 family metallopeptidase [Planctomycetota bacterium]|jgi:predicted Zn-dependent protease